jgi:septum formation protein
VNPFLSSQVQEKLVLASASPRRREILDMLGFQFEVVPARIEEEVIWEDPKRRTKLLAELKAVEIQRHRPRSTIIAADTVVVCGGKILGKPEGERDAVDMIETLAGRAHQVITGIALLSPPNFRLTDCEITTVYFRNLNRDEIETYLDTGESFGKAGGYAIQGFASLFVNRIEGCYFNVVGLPVVSLFNLFRELEKKMRRD